ncbi:Glutathione S-transferase class-mu isozyme [Echinococcus granulosus]|uniref:Glutathione S-transferase class-mu isozyme n=1 Tax=Echinococcus granulosus TaxID=6210 RepID=W6UFZ8_ECHGR|nr:Glutathione S-transferase class-mu isozyme [Echinococcus granulosus]EUB60405.1 Glutathione S-transferase class-mu isozyme [Echinococcus granulosus]
MSHTTGTSATHHIAICIMPRILELGLGYWLNQGYQPPILHQHILVAPSSRQISTTSMDLQLKQAKLRLLYFNIRGRAELIRLVLNAAEKDFQDVRVSSTEWPSLKAQMPFNQLPVLEVTTPRGEKVMLTESMAIARLLARTFGLYSDDAAEVYLIERMNSLTSSLLEEIYALGLKKVDSFKKLVEAEHVHEYMDAIEMALKERKSTFTAGPQVTLADLQVIVLIDTMDKFLANTKHDCKDELDKIKENVMKAKPGVARYLRSRPLTDF